MLNLLLLCLFILGWVYLIKYAFKVSYSIAFPLFTAFVILFGYVSYLKHLELFYHVAYYGGIALFIAVFSYCLFSKKIKDIFPQEVLLLLAIIFIAYIRFKNSYFSEWDEWMNWGSVLKEMYLFNGPSPQSSAGFIDYPKGNTTFLYIITKALGEYSEGNALFASALMFLFPASVLLVHKKIWQSLLLLACISLISRLYKYGLSSLYVDQVIGILFGCLVSIYLQTSDKIKGLLLITPLLLVLPIVKQIGFLLAYFSIAIIFIDIVCSRNFTKKKEALAILVGLLLVPYIADISWSYINGFFKTDLYQSKTVSSKIALLVHNLASEKYNAVISNFSYHMISRVLVHGSNILSMFVIYFSYRFLKKYPNYRVPKYIYISLLALFVIYCFHRLSLYLTVYGYDEAVTAASLKRYISTYVVGAMLIILTYLKIAMTDSKIVMGARGWSYLKIITCLLIIIIAARTYNDPPSSSREDVKQIKGDIKLIESDLKTKKVFMVFNNFDLLECTKYSYEFLPVYPQNLGDCFALASPFELYKLNENFYKNFSVDMFNSIKGHDDSKYDILFIPKGDQEMWQSLSKVIQVYPEHRMHKKFIRDRDNIFVPIQN